MKSSSSSSSVGAATKSPSSRRPRKAVPFWGRLETRVIGALVLLGVLCVGASAYLVQLAVAYFDERVGASLGQAERISAKVEPLHHELIEAHIGAFEARGTALAFEVALQDLSSNTATEEERLAELLEREADVVQIALERPDGRSSLVDREHIFPNERFDWFDVTAPLYDADKRVSGHIKVVFRIDPKIDNRYQALGELKREVGREQATRIDIEDAVVGVVGWASVAVLLVSVCAGFMLARTTTRKASALSSVMARVALGDLAVRSERLGDDELGQLAQSFNEMLDELQRAQTRVAYLQRIGAWQEMARRIAHEIKNPLTPIALAVQQLRNKDPGLSPEFSSMLRTSCEIVEDEVEALRRMVSSFSQFAKVPEVRRESVAIARVLEEFERAYGHLTEEANDVLRVESCEDVEVAIDGDRQLLKQALVNLVENAVLSAREAGRSPVVVEVRATADTHWVEIVVDDNGPGISQARLERVFEPYETSREQGTGLGLAIVKKIILDHDGEISAGSSPLGGARFSLRLPRLHS